MRSSGGMKRNELRRFISIFPLLLAACLACGASPRRPLPPAPAPAPAPLGPATTPVQDPIAAATTSAAASGEVPASVPTEGRVRVGVIHSLSGTTASFETPLMNAALMTIDEINRWGGVLRRELEPVVVDPASNWPLFAEKARELLEKERTSVVFGGYTSVSRKSMLPVFEELNGLNFYPAQHEGAESSRSVFYTGSVPNQSVGVVADYLARRHGKPIRRWCVIGTDYVVPRMQVKLLSEVWQASGVREDELFVRFTPFGHVDYVQVVQDLRRFAGSSPMAVISLLLRESAVALQQELVRQRVSPTTTPLVAFGLDERDVAKQGALFAGTLLARSYFSTIDHPKNAAFKHLFLDWARGRDLPPDRFALNDDVEATYIGMHLWKQAVESAKSFDTDRVTAALANQTFEAPSGYTVRMDPKNHHLHKPYFVAEVARSGDVKVVWRTPAVIPPNVPDVP
jgi:urea transport system substrate-binding protein